MVTIGTGLGGGGLTGRGFDGGPEDRVGGFLFGRRGLLVGFGRVLSEDLVIYAPLFPGRRP